MTAIVSRRRILQWLGFCVSLVAGLMNGSSTSFTVYATEIKNTFNYTQSQVELVSSVGLIGMGLSFLQSIILCKFGYKVVYVIIIVTALLSCLLVYVATISTVFFSKWAVLLGLFLSLADLSRNFMVLHITQIAVSNFSDKHVGKVIALYVGIIGLGKIVLCRFYEAFFVGDLGGFFLAVGCLWTALGVLCFFLHRPKVQGEEETTIVDRKEYKQDEWEEDTGIDNSATSIDDTKEGNKAKSDNDLLKSPYFHMMFWSSVIFYSCCITFVNNLTSFGESAGLENPLVLVYVLSLCTTASRVFVGNLYDHFPSKKYGFFCLYSCYFCFMVAMVIGLTGFNESSVFFMTFLVGASVAGSNSLSLTLLAAHFGRGKYSAIAGKFAAFLVPTILMFQMFVGYFYDREVTRGSSDTRVCYGSHCFIWSFVMLLCATVIVCLVQLLNQICVQHTQLVNVSPL